MKKKESFPVLKAGEAHCFQHTTQHPSVLVNTYFGHT